MISDIPTKTAQATIEYDLCIASGADPKRVVEESFFNTRFKPITIEPVNQADSARVGHDRKIRMRVTLTVQLLGKTQAREFIERYFTGTNAMITEIT